MAGSACPKHFRYLVYRPTGSQGVSRRCVAQVVEADLGWEASLDERRSEGSHDRVPATNLALRVREHPPRILPRGRGHPLLALGGAVLSRSPTVRGPMRTRLPSPVFVGVITVFVRVSAERLTST